MAYSKDVIKEKLNEINFLYDEELIIPNDYGCVMYLNHDERQWISIKFKPLSSHRILFKRYISFEPIVIKHKEARKIWNNYIIKQRNIKKLINKI